MENKKVLKMILFNILVILTILFIYFLLFPKKSYIETKINEEKEEITEEINIYDETFKNNFTSMKIAAINYFEKNDSKKVTLKEMSENELLQDLKDSNGEACSNESYAEKTNDSIKIYLLCGNTKKTAEINLITYEENKDDKLICIYEYQKIKEPEYTEWGEWSEWQTEKIESDDLTEVEVKDSTNTSEAKQQKISKPATENKKTICPTGYEEEDSKCKSKTKTNTINASIVYNCPSGYKKSGTKCYSNNETIDATKSYTCPTGDKYLEFELSGESCTAYKISYIQKKKKNITHVKVDMNYQEIHVIKL